MRCFASSMLLAAVWAGSLSAQEDPTTRLAEVLPPEVAARVLEHIEDAAARQLPAQAMADVALEGVAKGRTSAEVLAAVEALAGDMGRAQEALQAAGRTPDEGEIEAATTAMRMGVDAVAISDLARTHPDGRSLAVPMLVLGSLAERGLPSDEALSAVVDRMAARADDAGLIGDFPEIARGPDGGLPPGLGGTLPASAGVGPFAGMDAPVGPPTGARGRPDNVPGPPAGRGGGPGGSQPD